MGEASEKRWGMVMSNDWLTFFPETHAMLEKMWRRRLELILQRAASVTIMGPDTRDSSDCGEPSAMNLQAEHPPTKELIAMTTHEIVYEMEMYRAVQVAGDALQITPPMKRRVIEAQCELARRFARGWVATGKRAGGE